MRLGTSMDLTSHLLIAMPGMDDHNFSQTINLICWHDEDGAMGLVLNRPSSLMVKDLFSERPNKDSSLSSMVHHGGPVAPTDVFVLSSGESSDDSALHFDDHFSLSSSSKTIDSITHGEEPENYSVFLGYCGWDAKQLDEEINNNIWLTVKAEPELVFKTPAEDQWQAAARQLGIDINLMTMGQGIRTKNN